MPCAPLLLLVCLLRTLLLLLLYLCNRSVNSSPYLAFYPFPAEAALGRQSIKVSISFYAGQGGLLLDLNSIACMVAQGLHDRTLTQQTLQKRYKGINAIHLMAQGRSDARWMTYK